MPMTVQLNAIATTSTDIIEYNINAAAALLTALPQLVKCHSCARSQSEYVRQNIWVTTHPIEEPEHPCDMLSTLEWIGVDRVIFSTDDPHWDQDDPRLAFKVALPEAWKCKIYRENAQALYALD